MMNKSLPLPLTSKTCGGDAARKPGRSGSAGTALAESAFGPVYLLRWLALGLLALCALLQGCVNATVDEMTFMEPTEGIGDASVVIMGRRHAPDYETEFDFIECIGDHIRRGDDSITCLLYTSPSPRDLSTSRMPSSA